MVNIPTEAPAQLRHDLQDKDLDVPHEDKELEKALALFALSVIGNMKMLEDLRNTTSEWLTVMKQHQHVAVPVWSMLHTDLQDFFEGLTEMLSIGDAAKSIWTKGEVQKSFECQCKLMRDKWQTLKVRWHQFKQFQEEEQKPVVVENNEAPKKRRKLSFPKSSKG